jgi:hypothetical protein
LHFFVVVVVPLPPGAATPAPVKATVFGCAPPPRSVPAVSVPVRNPGAFGLKLTENVQSGMGAGLNCAKALGQLLV